MATATSRVRRMGVDARRNVEKSASVLSNSFDGVVSTTEKLRDELERRAEGAADQTRRRAAQLALSVIDFQKTTFDNSFKLIGQIQEQSEKMVSDLVSDSTWMPNEAKSIVDEWQKMLRGARTEFQRTVDKSFDLIANYLDRVRKDEVSRKPAKKSLAKKAAAKKPAAKKTAARKATAKATAKPAAKKPAAKKSSAKKASASSAS